MITNKIFRKRTPEEVYHYITIRNNKSPNKTKRVPLNNYKQLKNLIEHQKEYCDLFISKYGTDMAVNTIILDFDNEKNKQTAYDEVSKLMKYLKTVGLNSFIVDSTNKGYHLYIQIPPKAFQFDDYSTRDSNRLFNIFVNELINNRTHQFKCLDKINTTAGLGGNIRLIGSIHPKTGERCEIIDGSFKDILDCYKPLSKGYKYIDETLVKSYKILSELQRREEQKVIEHNERMKTKDYGEDFIKDNDLRELLPEIFNEEIKIYPKGYGYMKCFNHNDTHPSMLVTKEYFSCSACGVKGNIWSLHKGGYIDLFNDKEKI